MPRRYPLATLSGLRDAQVKVAAAARKDQEAVAGRAKADAAQAALATRTHVDSVTDVRERQAERLARGSLRAADLSQHGTWAHVAARKTEALRNAETALAREHLRAEEALQVSVEELTSRKREAEVVERHQARWTKTEHKRFEEAQAEELEDRWRPR